MSDIKNSPEDVSAGTVELSASGWPLVGLMISASLIGFGAGVYQVDEESILHDYRLATSLGWGFAGFLAMWLSTFWIYRRDHSAAMGIRELHQAKRAEPFRPFTIHLADGRSFSVPHPEFIFISRNERTVIVDGVDDSIEIIDAAMVTSISLGNGEAADGGS